MIIKHRSNRFGYSYVLLIYDFQNTDSELARVLKGALYESSEVNIAVAFLKKSGLDTIREALEYALTKRNAQIEIIVGLDFKTTDQRALLALQELKTHHKNFVFTHQNSNSKLHCK